MKIKNLLLVIIAIVALSGCESKLPNEAPKVDMNDTVNNPSLPSISLTPVELGTNWMAFGDSETNGRANETSAKSQIIAFQNILEQTHPSPQEVYVDAIGGRELDGTNSAYSGMYNYLTSPVTWLHFQESGGQSQAQDTPEEFVLSFENMVRSIVQKSPNAVISTETAYSFEAEGMTNPTRDWTQHNILMRLKVAELKSEGISLYLAEVDRNIQELVLRKRVELGEVGGQQAVWGDTDDSIGRHYTGLGNFMVALSMFYALNHDITTLDYSQIIDSEVSLADKNLCINIINLLTQTVANNTSSSISGTVLDGAILTLRGSGLGSSTMDYQFLGGADGHIEQTAETKRDINFGNWLLNSNHAPKQIVSNANVRSGSKAYYMNVYSDGHGEGTGQYDGDIRYVFNETIPQNTKLYFSWWVKLNVKSKTKDGQWKLLRLNYDNQFSNDGTEFFMSNWPEGNRFLYVTARDGSSSAVVLYGNEVYPENDDSWYRMEVALTTSTQGVRDGNIEISRHHPDIEKIKKGFFRRSSGEPEPTYPATQTYATDKRYKYLIWQNYLGNGFTSSDIYMDDLYIQVGGFERIEIGDKPNWNDCTFRDIQPVVSWDDGEIKFKFNKGGLQSGKTYYLFLVDEDNTPYGSYPISIQ